MNPPCAWKAWVSLKGAKKRPYPLKVRPLYVVGPTFKPTVEYFLFSAFCALTTSVATAFAISDTGGGGGITGGAGGLTCFKAATSDFRRSFSAFKSRIAARI